MPKLSTLRPAIGKLPPLLATMRDTRDTAQATGTQPWRQWYKSKRWQMLRQQVLQRDLYTCQQTGVVLSGGPNQPNSPVVDHIRPHRGDARLFWDPANLQSVTKSWHDSDKQRQERKGNA